MGSAMQWGSCKTHASPWPCIIYMRALGPALSTCELIGPCIVGKGPVHLGGHIKPYKDLIISPCKAQIL